MAQLFTLPRRVGRSLLPLFLLLAATWPALALEANQIRVLHSDGTPVVAADGVSASGYLGNSHRSYGTLVGDGVFEFPSGTSIDNARISRHYLTSPALPLAAEAALVDFRVDVFASPFQGGGAVSVNHGLSLYQGGSHKAYFPAPAIPGQYHIDVVPGQSVRASVTKDYLTAFTETADPVLSSDADVSLQLVDFRADVFASPFQGGGAVSVNHGLSLYQGGSHKAYFPAPATAGQYHIDVVPGQSVRASVTKDYLTAFTETADPALSGDADVSLQLVDFRADVFASPLQGGGAVSVNHGLSLYQGGSHKAYFPAPAIPGQYHIDVVPGQSVRASVTKDYLTAFTETADPALSGDADVSLQLVDFRADVFASPFQGGGAVNVNHGLSLYQGGSHKAYFPAPATAGQYHLDVVPGQSVRASVTKDYLTAFTETADPVLSADADVSLQLVDFRADVYASPFQGGAAVSVNHGLSLYQGGSHKAYFPAPATAGQYHIDVVPGQSVRASVTKDYLTAFTETADPVLSADADVSLQLVDFRADVLASEYRGGAPVNVNHGLSLYQGNSHKAYFPAPATAGQYHLDVVPGQSVRASVTKDYLTAFTEATDPALSGEADVSLRLVDFCVGLDTWDCAPVTLMGASLYQGNSHKAYIAFSNPVSSLHHDVVPGVAVRASLTQFYQTVFTQALDPQVDRETDVWHDVPTVRFQFSSRCGENGLQLFRDVSFMTTLPQVSPDLYEVPLLNGLTNLWVRMNAWQSVPFNVETGRETLLVDGILTVSEEAGTCNGGDEPGEVAVEINTSDVQQLAGGLVELSWSTAQESELLGFRVLRDGVDLDTLLTAVGSSFGAQYHFVDAPGTGSFVYTIQRLGTDGSLNPLLDLPATVVAQPTSFALLPAVPNPFNPSTRLSFEVAESAPLRLAIYNIQGQEVAVLVDGMLEAGRHDLQFTPQGLASGVYLAVLRHPHGQEVQRLTLLR